MALDKAHSLLKKVFTLEFFNEPDVAGAAHLVPSPIRFQEETKAPGELIGQTRGVSPPFSPLERNNSGDAPAGVGVEELPIQQVRI